MPLVNVKTLSEISQKSPTAEAFFTYAACRSRAARSGMTRIGWAREVLAKEGFKPVPQELLSMFRELESAGVGRLHGDRFAWSVPITEVAALMRATTERGVPAVEEPAPAPVTTRSSLVVSFGPKKTVRIDCSGALTPEEIEFAMKKLLNPAS